MKVCVVGGTGNISISIVKLLLKLGHNVTCFNRGQRSEVPEGAKVILGDRLERDRFEKIMRQESFDAAIDAICFNQDDALSDIRAFRGVSHFIQISTVCTYGFECDWLPVTEDHPLRPMIDYGRNKVAADETFMKAYRRDGFPVSIVKPSTTYGPQQGLVRQIAAKEYSWLNRIMEGRPILICGDGLTIHQFLHVDDAALCFAHMLGRAKCIGRVYNMVHKNFVTWRGYHETAMKVLGRTVEMVGVSTRDLELFGVPGCDICQDIFAYNCYYSAERLFQDVPEFKPNISLEDGMRDVFNSMQQQKRIPASEHGGWEDRIIERVNVMHKHENCS